MNAATGQEVTQFYVRMPDRHLPLALEILSDIVWSPALRDEDVESERQVILEEIRMRDDTPDDLVHELFAGALFPGHPLGREIAGTQETIGVGVRATRSRRITACTTTRRTSSSPSPGTSTTTTSSRTVEASLPPPSAYVRSPRVDGVVRDRPAARTRSSSARSNRRTSCSGCDRSTATTPTATRSSVLDQVLGGGMSSRLFQEVREVRGLAYSVFSYRSAFEETGALAVYCGTSPEHVEEVLGSSTSSWRAWSPTAACSDRELERAKGHMTGSLALSLESSSSRMHRIGRAELTLGEVPEIDEVVARVDAVDHVDVARVIERVVAPGQRTLAAVGPMDDARRRGAANPLTRVRPTPVGCPRDSCWRLRRGWPHGYHRVPARWSTTPTSSSLPRSTRSTPASTCGSSVCQAPA